ncbi:alcohol dehydrogenase [Pelagibius sp. Alg239-R121]|uniref:alcohol dehydrogenase n=1 Tax=Pelagibius sp. Alg239-R121 TaxID=2993448 RepID=UPI0024A76929|nr:alcohol dehydrogenase [Pelagibius sp. Alg239-R121]
MATYRSYDLVEFGKPLKAREREVPSPEGTQVLLRVRRSGVCHSDLHIAEGFFDLGEEGQFRMADRGMRLPVTMGHEIVGEVLAVGPEAGDLALGKMMLVFPWIGCGECRACKEDRENDCMEMRIIGLVRDGGYATHVLVDHPKFLIDVEGLNPDTVAPHACSGLTVYNALKKIGPVNDGEWLSVMGAGGLGLNAIAIARAMGHERIISVDIDPLKLQAAASMGAQAVLDGSRDDALEELRRITDNQLLAVLDTVGAPSTSRLAVHALVKTGRYVVVGLYGGDFRMPLPWLPQKALTVRGCHVGSSGELRELIALVRSGRVQEIPVTSRALSEVNETLSDLKAGKITGRVVLTAD